MPAFGAGRLADRALGAPAEQFGQELARLRTGERAARVVDWVVQKVEATPKGTKFVALGMALLPHLEDLFQAGAWYDGSTIDGGGQGDLTWKTERFERLWIATGPLPMRTTSRVSTRFTARFTSRTRCSIAALLREAGWIVNVKRVIAALGSKRTKFGVA